VSQYPILIYLNKIIQLDTLTHQFYILVFHTYHIILH